MTKTICVSLFFLFIANFSFSQIPQQEQVDALFADWDKKDAPGCALGIFKSGEIIYSKGYGQANLEYSIPNTPQSIFRIASTSKQFTAACIVLLDEQGKLNLSDPLSKFYPDFPSYAKDITVLHLLNHTSGVRDYLTLASIAGYGDMDHYKDRQVERWLRKQEELNFEPGSEFLYSNSGYWLLGQIVEKASGKNMRDFAQKEIFEPLKMTNTHFHNDHTEVVPKRSTGYYPNGEGGYLISQTTLEMIGDGGIFTTIEDMKRWDDEFSKQEVLKASFWEKMTTKGLLNSGAQIDYAAGLFIGNHNGLSYIDHGGAFVGYRAQFLRFPDQEFSIVIFANRGDANPGRLSFEVADIFLSDMYVQEEEGPTQNDEKIEMVALDKAELEKFEGDYWNEESGYSRRIYLKDGSLYYYRNEYSETKLVPTSSNTFAMDGLGNLVKVEFKTNDTGPSKMIFYQNGELLATSDYYEKSDAPLALLDSLQGKYYSQELDSEIELKYAENSLTAYQNSEVVGDLQHVKEKLFSIGGMLIAFSEEDPSIFRINAGRVKNLKYVKVK